MGDGTVGYQGFGRTRSFELPAGSGAPVSQQGRAALRFHEGVGALQVSIDGAAYVPLGGSGSSPWLDDGAGNVRLQDTSNDVVIGGVATVGTERLRVVGDALVEGQVQTAEVTTAPGGAGTLALSSDGGDITATVSGATGYQVQNGGGDALFTANPTSNEVTVGEATALVALAEQWATRSVVNVGVDAAAFDVREGGVSRFTLDSVSNTISTGTAADPLDAVVHGNVQFNVPTADPNALRVRDSAGAEYVNVDTTVGAETITMGAAANPVFYEVTVPDNASAVYRVVDQNGDPYITVTTVNNSEFVGFGNNNTVPDYFFNGASATVVVGADASGQVEAASFGPGTTSFFSRPMFVGTDTQATAITMGHDAAALTIDSSSLTLSSATVLMTLPDSTAGAFEVDDDAGDTYLLVSTAAGTESIALGNAVNNPDTSVLGTGEISLGATGARIGVLGAPPVAQTAAYTVTNPVDRRSFDAATVPTDELAEVVGTIIADMQLLGYFGS